MKHYCHPYQVPFSNTVCVLWTSELVPTLYQCETAVAFMQLTFVWMVAISNLPH